MKRRPIPYLFRSFLTVIILLLIIYVLIATNIGLQNIAWFAQRFVPGLHSLQVEGRLIGPISIENLDYRNKEIAIQLQQASLDWQPGALLKRNVVIENFVANNLVIKLADTEKQKKKKETNLNWLNHFFIKNIQIKSVIIDPSNLKLALQGSLTDKWDIQWQAQLLQSKNKLTQSVNQSKNSTVLHAAWPGVINRSEQFVKTRWQHLPKFLEAKIKPNKLEAILHTLGGTITASGAIQGPKLTPKINAVINATDLTVEQLQAAKLQIAVTTDLTPNMESSLTLTANNFKYKNYLFNTVNLQAQGQINPALSINWQLRANLQPSEKYRGNVVAQGTVSGNYKTPVVEAAISVKQGKIEAAQFANLNARLHADLAEQAQSALQLDVNGLKIKKYQFAPIRVQAQLNRLRRALLIQLADGSMRYKSNEETRTLTWQASAINIFQQAKDVNVQGRLVLNAQQYIDLKLKLPQYQFFSPLTPQQVVQGNISLYVQQITPFLSAVPNLQNVKGLLHADLQISGTYAKPQLLGNIALENASAEVPNLNLKIKNIQLRAQGTPAGIVNWTGQAQSGQGILYLKGSTALRQQNYPTTLVLTGSNITVSNNDHYKINVTPNLQAKYLDNHLTITGSILLPSVNINLSGGSEQAVELSKDVVFVGEAHKKPSYDLPFYVQVQVIAGNEVNLHYEGLQTQLRGQLLINDAPNHPVTGVGQISFNKGSYTFYGQTLEIRPSSRVIFNGAIDNPMLNIQAVKQVDAASSTNSNTKSASDLVPTTTELSSNVVLAGQTQKITVGVSVQGEAKNPEINLFSEPAMNQTDILSYLVVGQPADQLGSASAGILFNAASSLNFGGSSQLKDTIKELQDAVGVDVNIQSSSYLNPQTYQTQQNTSVVLGKALSPRIYISYSIGVLESINTLQIRYKLSKLLTLQSTTSSVGNGVDLLYMIERGK